MAAWAKGTLRALLCGLFAVFLQMLPPIPYARACQDFSSAPNSRWKVVEDNGVAWLLTPCGERFFSIGINALNGGAMARETGGRVHYYWGTSYPNFDAWLLNTRARMRAWGFNTAGGWSLHPNSLRLPTIPNLELGRLAQFHWFDPFDPRTEEQMRRQAQLLVAPYKNNPYRIGYFSDNEVGWWNGALFTYYIKQPATNHTKQRLIALLREHYNEDWAKFTRDFVTPPDVASFTDLLRHSGTIPHLRPGSEGIQVVRRWTGIVAERYYQLVHRVLREADPEALILGDRLPIYYDPIAVRAMAPYVDAIATNYDVDSHDGWVARYFFDGLRRLTGNKPIVISEWFFAARENRTGNLNNGHLMTVQTQAERARGAAVAAKQFARIPGVVGMHWFQYYDYPRGGRGDGEDYNFGLVDIDDRPYEPLVAAFSRINPQLFDIHKEAPPSQSQPTELLTQIFYADINPEDHSLREWPKEYISPSRFAASESEVAFGDAYLAWNQRGLYLAIIGMDYYDPMLLVDGDPFPREEAFRIDWGADAGGGPRRFALFISPPRVHPEKEALQMRVEICHMDHATCNHVRGAVTTYFGSDTPRITAETFLPWEALGVEVPPDQQQLRMELAMTAFHRSRWMSWSGLPPGQAMQDSSRWRTVKLAGEGR
jgi:hypothetical protein